MESPHLNIRELYVILPLIFNDAALILKTDQFDDTDIDPANEIAVVRERAGALTAGNGLERIV